MLICRNKYVYLHDIFAYENIVVFMYGFRDMVFAHIYVKSLFFYLGIGPKNVGSISENNIFL